MVTIRAPLLSDWDNYCPGTPFLNQPTAGTCSGVLIDADLILTAGHCLDQVQSCRDYYYVFGYFESAAETLAPITRADVYSCRAVAGRFTSPPDSVQQVNWAIIQLDRPVDASRTPVVFASAGALAVGQPLSVIGCPSGLPTKIDQGAKVVDAREATLDYFTLTSDTFDGSSGSGVFDANRSLVGAFVRGTADYVQEGIAAPRVSSATHRALAVRHLRSASARRIVQRCLAEREPLCDKPILR